MLPVPLTIGYVALADLLMLSTRLSSQSLSTSVTTLCLQNVLALRHLSNAKILEQREAEEVQMKVLRERRGAAEVKLAKTNG
mmetsp:Transcript_21536/g.60994  ORF Transcript_21536/g.60994 Transcript_21536/m.60994 type:complete len:82 (-) Transcript_21536:175-420(-)